MAVLVLRILHLDVLNYAVAKEQSDRRVVEVVCMPRGSERNVQQVLPVVVVQNSGKILPTHLRLLADSQNSDQGGSKGNEEGIGRVEETHKDEGSFERGFNVVERVDELCVTIIHKFGL